MSKQAMEMALEALESQPRSTTVRWKDGIDIDVPVWHTELRDNAISALKEALQHDAEPVAWRWRSPLLKDKEWEVTRVNPKNWGTTLGIEIEPLYLSAPSIPPGWQLVPKEPTLEMVIAGENMIGRHAHKAMIAASPQPKGEQSAAAPIAYLVEPTIGAPYLTFLDTFTEGDKRQGMKRTPLGAIGPVEG